MFASKTKVPIARSWVRFVTDLSRIIGRFMKYCIIICHESVPSFGVDSWNTNMPNTLSAGS